MPSQVYDAKGWRYVFEGRSDSIRLVVPAPRGAGLNGLMLMWLEVRRKRDGAEVSVAWRAFSGSRDRLTRPPEIERTVLVDGVTRATLAYMEEGEEGIEPRWVAQWENERWLPTLVRLRIEDEDSPWPDLIAPFRVRAEHACVIRSPARGLCQVPRYD